MLMFPSSCRDLVENLKNFNQLFTEAEIVSHPP